MKTESNFLLGSTALQVFWLLAILWTGASHNEYKLYILLAYTLVMGVAVTLAPAGGLVKIWPGLGAAKTHVRRHALCVFGIGVTGIGLVYSSWQRVEALVAERSVYHASLVVATEGLSSFFACYRDLPWLGIQHPPLVLVINGLAMRVVGEDLFTIRLVSVVFGIATLLAVYGLDRELRGRQVGLSAAISFVSFPYFFRLSAAASNDIQVTFFFSVTLLIVFRLRRDPSIGLAILGGFALAGGLLSKYPMLLIYPVLGYLLVAHNGFKPVRGLIAVLMSTSFVIFLSWLVFSYYLGIFTLQESTLSGFSTSQFSTVWGKWMLLEFLTTRLPSALGVYTLPPMILGAVCLGRRWRDPDIRFLFVWVGVVFGAFALTLPDARYCMPAFPALAIIMAAGMGENPRMRGRMLWLIAANCAGALYLFVDWQRASHLFIDDYIWLMP